eukprot:XP_011670751.1 PREDICTED: uncharacterized protein LOC100888615 [Strongylocentrotus purpuratus]
MKGPWKWKLIQEEVIRAWWSSDLEKELLSLVKDVSPRHYYDLCKALDISDKQSEVILTQNLLHVSDSLYEVIHSWRVKQRDGTYYKRFLAEKLRTVHLDALASKLVEGGYSTKGSPTQSSVADEVHPVNKLTQEESLLFEEALMNRKESPTKESEKPVESVDDDERVNCFGFTEELSANLLDTKVLTINVKAPEEHEAFLKEQEPQYHPEQAEEPQYHPPITSWAWDADRDRTILDLQQSNLPLTEVLSFVAQSCPKLRILRLHANVPVSISEESVLESDSTTYVDKSDEDDSSEFELYMRCRQTTDVPFRALLAIVSSIFPKISDLTLDGDDQTKLDILGYMHPLPSSFLPKLRRLCLQQFVGPLCLLTFFKCVVEKLSHLPFLQISQCNVNVQTESEMEFNESALSHLEIIPANVIPFACLNELVFKAFKSITNFMVQNIAAEHQIYLLLNWTKTGQMPTEKLYLKQSTPLKAFKDLLTIVNKFPRISKLETDECGSLERTEILEIVRTCTQLQYFSSVASGVSCILAISDQFMRKSTSKPISKSFGKLGGELRLETHDITLCVPKGAIQGEGEIEIVLQALTNSSSTHFQEDEMVCSFGFQCTVPNAPGFRFAVPVRVTLPHCAILDDPSKVATGIYHGELWHDTGDVEISTITYIPPSEHRLPRCEVDEKEITVFIDHFSFEWPVLKIRNPFVKGKRLGCLPFVPKKMPPMKKPILRVYLFDIVRGNPEEIEKDESKCDFRMARPKIELQARDDLVVTYGMDGSNNHDNKQSLRTILFSDIRQLIQNTVDFRLDFSERVEQFAAVNLSVTEGTKNRGNLPFDVDFTGDASGSSQGAMAVEGSASYSTSQLVMADILTDEFMLKLSKKIDPQMVTAADFSIYLGLSRAEGGCAAIQANVVKNQREAFKDLLSEYVLRNGRKSASALKLRNKFRENGMKDYADVIEAELKKFNIPVPSDEDSH